LGLAAGAGQYVLAAMTVALAFLILKVMAGIESRFGGLYRDADDPAEAPTLPPDEHR
jgi:uncharacterized membrane protein YhiD involved in acid resistance